ASVDFQTLDGAATVVDNDYQANTGTITFAPEETSKQITVLVNGDTKFESDEDFIVHLSNPINATIVNGATTTAFSNPAPIIIPDAGASSPYPSSITVIGMRGVVSDVTVTLKK